MNLRPVLARLNAIEQAVERIESALMATEKTQPATDIEEKRAKWRAYAAASRARKAANVSAVSADILTVSADMSGGVGGVLSSTLDIDVKNRVYTKEEEKTRANVSADNADIKPVSADKKTPTRVKRQRFNEPDPEMRLDLQAHAPFVEAWTAYRKMREAIGKPLTTFGIRTLWNKLADLTPAQATELVCEAESRKWQGFEWSWLKRDQPGRVVSKIAAREKLIEDGWARERQRGGAA